MASQPRPWRRLPSMIRGPAPAMAPPPATPAAPAPAPPVTRPMAPMATFRSASPPPPPESQPEPQAQRESTPPPAPPPAAAPPSEPGTPQARGTYNGSLMSTPVSRPVGPSQVQGSASSLPPSPAPAPRTSPPAVASPPVPAPRISSPPSLFSPRLSSRVSAPNSPVQTQNRVPSPSMPSPPPPPPPPPMPSPAIAPVAMPVPTQKMQSERVITPVPSPPKVVKPETESRTPPQSPKARPVAPPPSPLSLPPTQIKTMEAEQKKVLMHEKVPSPDHNNHIRRDGEMHRESVGETNKHDLRHGHGHGPGKGIMDAHKKHQHHEKKHSEEEVGVKVITLAGENKGAVMNLLRSPKTGRFLHKRDNMTNANESGSSSTSGGEDRPKIKDKSNKPNAGMSPPVTAFMNSNVQGVNNSIVFNSSCTHHDPGVHLSFSRKPLPHGIHQHHNQAMEKDGANAKGH